MGGRHGERSGGNSSTGGAEIQGGTPGKRARTERLPPHHEMTGVDAIDLADDLAAADEDEQFLAPARSTTIALIGNAVGAMYSAQGDAISNVLLDETTASDEWSAIEWSWFIELGWRGTTGPFGELLAAVLARKVARYAVPVAELGLHRAAWYIGGVDQKAMGGVVNNGLASMRTFLAHPHKNSSVRKQETRAFLKTVQSAQGPGRIAFMEAAVGLPGRELTGLYVGLREPEVFDVGGYEARVRTLIDRFRVNRITSIGNVMDLDGGLEVATVRRVRLYGREYVVLLESHGARNLRWRHDVDTADQGRADTRPEELVFVRLVERTMHDAAIEQLKAKRGARALEGRSLLDVALGHDGVEVIDFDVAANRAAHPWSGAFLREHQARARARSLDEVASTGENPYALHTFALGVEAP